MRPLHAQYLYMREFADEDIPPYVIVSHRWREDEVTHQDFEHNTFSRSYGYHKVKESCRIAHEANYN